VGDREDIYNFVGGSLDHENLGTQSLHNLAFRERGDLLTVVVQLFASFGAPSYEVVVGSRRK